MKYDLLFHAREGHHDTEAYYDARRHRIVMVVRNTDPAVCVAFGTQRTEIPVSRAAAIKAARRFHSNTTRTS